MNNKIYTVEIFRGAYDKSVSPYAATSSTTIYKTFSAAESFIKDVLQAREKRGCIISCYFDLINEEERRKRLYVIKTSTGYETLFITIDWGITL